VLATIDLFAIDGSEQRDITLTAGSRELRFQGQQYLVSFALPNFYFHVTTAYAILRHCGVPIGKRDFLGVVLGLAALHHMQALVT